jgi:hypothetical protein
MAGYPGKANFYYLARGTVEPPQELLDLTPMGRWVYTAHEGVEEKVLESENAKHQTAWQVLWFFKDLNRSFLQDAAAMVAEDESRGDHEMFRVLPVFKTRQWEDYLEKMKGHLSTDSCPLDAKLENVIPGLHQWHRANDSSLRQLSETIDGFKEKLESNTRSVVDSLKQEISVGFSRAADSLSPRRKQQSETGALSELVDIFDGHEHGGPTDETTNDGPTKLIMKPKHNSLSSLYQEWYGIGVHKDSLGGVAGRDRRFGTRWRKDINRQHYSRVKRIVVTIDAMRDQTG